MDRQWPVNRCFITSHYPSSWPWFDRSYWNQEKAEKVVSILEPDQKEGRNASSLF